MGVFHVFYIVQGKKYVAYCFKFEVLYEYKMSDVSHKHTHSTALNIARLGHF